MRGSVDQDGLVAAVGEPDTGWRRGAAISVPVQFAELPDGGRSLMIGDVTGYAAFNHLQGDNPDHDCGDCGVMSCAEVLNQFGVRLTEADAVRHATRFRELHVVDGRPDESGWTLPDEQAAILRDYGVPAHAEDGQTIERLALAVQHGHGVIAMVNAGVLWSDPRALGHGQANHAVTVTGIARHPYDGALQGFYINDSGNGESGRFVSAHQMSTAFEHTGGFCVLTEIRSRRTDDQTECGLGPIAGGSSPP
jgi:Peptidase_C39 like family